MKTLRFFGMVLMTILLSVSFAACSSDDDGNSIKGRWYKSDGKVWGADVRIVVYDFSGGSSGSQHLLFGNYDGSCPKTNNDHESYERFCTSNFNGREITWWESSTYKSKSFSYTLSGETLTIIFNDYSDVKQGNLVNGSLTIENDRYSRL